MTTKQVFKWEDLPPTSRMGQKHVWPERLAPLKSRPGKWGNFGDFAGGGAPYLRRTYGPQGFEFSMRNLNDARGTLYARYVGPPVRGKK